MYFLIWWRSLALLLLVSLTPVGASATHIVGGELDLQHQSGSAYSLTLNLYFDAVNGNPGAEDPAMRAGIFEKATNRRMADLSLPRISSTFVNYTNPACATGSLSTRKLVYQVNITLPANVYTNAAGYYVAVERCCRNVTITNIVDPADAAQAFYLEFPAVVRNGQPFIDSTPRIFPPLSDYACRNELFYYDFGGTDTDGDSLAYDLVTPLNGHATATDPAPGVTSSAPYPSITWRPGLSVQNQIPGTPALAVHPRTGRLTVRPGNLGLFVFGVRCSEYRGGRKIGETRRDFQLYVLSCPQNARPTLRLSGPGNRLYRPGRDTLRLVTDGERCIRIRTTDADANTRLTITTRAVNFTGTAPLFTTSSVGTVRGPGAPDTLVTTLCFPDCADTQGRVYLLDVMVADEGCSLPRRDTVRLAFIAAPSRNTAPALTSVFPGATSSPLQVTVPRGAVYTGTLAGTDLERNALTLSATGQGFNLAGAGMTFSAQNGQGQAAGTFRWEPGCSAGAPATRLVRFLLTEAGPCVPLTRELTVQFRLVPTADTVAFELPNIITPNNDGKNDFFRMPDLPGDFCSTSFATVRIFSR